MSLQITEENFQELIESDTPVLVDFWAEWCGPCRVIGPVIDKVAEEFDGRAIVGKVNVDENGDLAARFGIRSIPTVLVFKGGEVVERLTGSQPQEAYTTKLEEQLKNN